MPEGPTACYLYAFSCSHDALDATPPARGVGGAAVEVVAGERVSAFVGWLRADERDELKAAVAASDGALDRRAEAAVRAHGAVIQKLFDQVPLVPLRFGTLLEDRAALDRLLAVRGDGIEAAAIALRAYAEWDVRIAWDPEQVVTAPEASLVSAATSGGAAYLSARRDAQQRRLALQRLRSELADRLDASLREHAAAGSRTGAAGRVLLHASYLVARDDGESFDAAVRDVVAASPGYGLWARLAGPLAPYSFCRIRTREAA